MSRSPTKAAGNAFCEARKHAATFNDRLNSREGAAEELSIDRTRLARIELGSLWPYPEEVLLMADCYNAPELLNHFCCNICPIGCRSQQKVEVEELDRLTVKLLAAMRNGDSYNRYGFVIDFADIKQNFQDTNEEYLRELNRFNDPEETGKGNETDTFQQVIEDPNALIAQMQEVRQALFEYSTDNAEEFSSEISTIEDRTELLKLKKALISARDCCNMVRTFGDEELKAAFATLELPKISQMISEVQHHIDAVNQKEAFNNDDSTKLLVNEAMQDITFNFSKIGEEEMKLISGGVELQEKWQKTIRGFTQNIDQDDPEFITLREAFMQRFKEHGFVVNTIHEFEEHSKALDEILKKLAELQKRNNALLKKYRGDEKFVRVHKRIREENAERKKAGKVPIVSLFDESIMSVLLTIKSDLDQKVYDRNDILKKDAYFEKTVMTQIKTGMDKLNLSSEREDRLFIQSRITR